MYSNRRSFKRPRVEHPAPRANAQAEASFPRDDTTQAAAAQEEIVTCYWCLEERPISQCCQVNKACYECIRERFEKAAQSEEHYPLKWPGIELQVDDYIRILPLTLVKRFKEKEKEYRTPVDERIYCRTKRSPPVDLYAFMLVNGAASRRRRARSPVECGGFVGRIKTLPSNGDSTNVDEEEVQDRCKACGTSHCLVCGQVYANGGHQCHGIPPAREADEALIGVPGKDFQYCPSTFCRRKIHLVDGCNHMFCPCGQSFCYICGESVDPRETEHWTRDGCPRYNHPEHPNANWDDEADDQGLGGPGDNVDLERFRLLQQQRRGLGRRIESRLPERSAQDPTNNHDPLSTSQNAYGNPHQQQAFAEQQLRPDIRRRRNAIAPILPRRNPAPAALAHQFPIDHEGHQETQRDRGGRVRATRPTEVNNSSHAIFPGLQNHARALRNHLEEHLRDLENQPHDPQNAALRTHQILLIHRQLSQLRQADITAPPSTTTSRPAVRPDPALTPLPSAINTLASPRNPSGSWPRDAHLHQRGLANASSFQNSDPPLYRNGPASQRQAANSQGVPTRRRSIGAPGESGVQFDDPTARGSDTHHHIHQRLGRPSLRPTGQNNQHRMREIAVPRSRHRQTFTASTMANPTITPAFSTAPSLRPAPHDHPGLLLQGGYFTPVYPQLHQTAAAQDSQAASQPPHAASQGMRTPMDDDVEMMDEMWDE